MTYDERNREALNELHPVVAARVAMLLHNLECIGEDVLVYSGKRTPEEQDALYAQGRTVEGEIVTHVNDSNSYHVWKCAVDIVPIEDGEAVWDDNDRFDQIARLARELNFEWGYQLWGWDRSHFHYSQGLTIAQLKAGERLMDETDPRPKYAIHQRVQLRRRKRINEMGRKGTSETTLNIKPIKPPKKEKKSPEAKKPKSRRT